MNLLKERGIDFAVLNIPPTGTWGHLSYSKNHQTCEMGLRKRIYGEFHDKLRKFCLENGYKLIDVWDLVIGEDGFTKHEYKADEVHLSKKALSILMKEVDEVFPERRSA